MIPPGIPDWYTRRRLVDHGSVTLGGRAWAGAGVAVSKVEVSFNGAWHEAEVEPQRDRYAWQGWRYDWRASPGEYELSCRATDASGGTQPAEPVWNTSGMGNNAIQRVPVTVR